MTGSSRRLLRAYATVSTIFTTAALAFFIGCWGFTYFLPERAIAWAGEVTDTLSKEDGCSGGYMMQQNSLNFLTFKLQSRHFVERCAEFSTALEMIRLGLQHQQPEISIVGLVALRKMSGVIDVSAGEVAECSRKIETGDDTRSAAELCLSEDSAQ